MLIDSAAATAATPPAPHCGPITGLLPLGHLKMALRDCLDGHKHSMGRRVRPGGTDTHFDQVHMRLWREDPDMLLGLYDEAKLGSLEHALPCPEKAHGRLAERMSELRRPLLYRNKEGLGLSDIAKQAGMHRETLAALMEHHGYLETVPFGGQQNRRLVTDQAFFARYGHNVDPSAAHIAHLEGHKRAAVFPVFYPEVVSAILWTLDLEGIEKAATIITNKRNRLQWLLAGHGYLPDAEIARIAGYSLRGIKKARLRERLAADKEASDVVRHDYSLTTYAREAIADRAAAAVLPGNDNTTMASQGSVAA